MSIFYIHDHNRLHLGNFSQNICLTCIMRINYDNILSSYTNEEVDGYATKMCNNWTICFYPNQS